MNINRDVIFYSANATNWISVLVKIRSFRRAQPNAVTAREFTRFRQQEHVSKLNFQVMFKKFVFSETIYKRTDLIFLHIYKTLALSIKND